MWSSKEPLSRGGPIGACQVDIVQGRQHSLLAGRTLAADRHLAVAAASLYLANLLILPGIAFLILLGLAGWRKQ